MRARGSGTRPRTCTACGMRRRRLIQRWRGGENSKCSYQEAFRDLDRALRDFTASRTGERKGRRLGFPRFKKRGRCKDSFRFSTGAMRCAGSTVTLPRLGTIGTHEPTRKLTRRRCGQCCADSSGRAAHSRKAQGSANRRKHAAQIARIHARVANVRADALHKATTGLARRYETVVAEDLNVTGMTRNRRLARAISDQGFGQARRMLGYKTAWNGGTLILADRWYPSSKTCSGCGAAKTKLALSERTYHCDHCGLHLNRDVNAARNLLSLAASGAESQNACGGCARPGTAGPRPAKQEPGTVHAGKTGTAGPQVPAASHALTKVT